MDYLDAQESVLMVAAIGLIATGTNLIITTDHEGYLMLIAGVILYLLKKILRHKGLDNKTKK